MDNKNLHFSEATQRQQEASRPDKAVWVAASAGTGKTKVLSDRFLRLLLPRTDQQGKAEAGSGTPPERILCLTFTKAAAAEMENRIRKRLSKWATMDEAELIQNIHDLTGTLPDATTLRAARRLFARTVDAPGGMKIMTIHAFCQSTLARFPLEAGITPDFTVMDERQSEEELERVRKTVMAQMKGDAFLSNMMQDISGFSVTAALTSMIGEREKITRALDAHGGVDGYVEKLAGHFNLPTPVISRSNGDEKSPDIWQGDSSIRSFHSLNRNDALLNTFLQSTDRSTLTEFIHLLTTHGTANDQNKFMAPITESLNEQLTMQERFNLYQSGFLTKTDNTLVKRLATLCEKNAPHLLNFIEGEAARILEVQEQLHAIRICRMTHHLLTLFEKVNTLYRMSKDSRSMLDFDDQIALTARLLEDNKGGWVLYKLDGGLDHILVDEAQDTNSDQWRIIRALSDDMLSGNATDAGGHPRTVFVVGDEKQSIYSFQNADPKYFADMHDYFAEKFEAIGNPMLDVPLNISFRSTEAVLNSVNTVFDDPFARHGLTQNPQTDITHSAFREKQPGSVTLWPYLVQADHKAQRDLFHLPVSEFQTDNAQVQLANTLAETIKDWIDSKRILPARGRPIEAGDILVLVTKRSHFVGPFVKALKSKNVPVAGIDKIKLTAELVVQDLMALFGTLLLPSDDLSLACVLKSPFIGMDEDTLFDLAHDRGNVSLWEVIRTTYNDPSVFDWLNRLQHMAGEVPPFDMLAHVLSSPCPADKRSGRRAILKRLGDEATDPLDILLSQALQFEHSHAPSLQEFHQWLLRSEAEIKRELESSGGHAVRIMTVHGAKGLQAPVVILPDCFKSSQSGNKDSAKLDWLDDAFPCYTDGTTNKHTIVQAEKDRQKELEAQEYRRLLYVAMTRAEDELYITGWCKESPKPKEESWYNLIEKGLSKVSQEHPAPWTDLPLSGETMRVFVNTGDQIMDEGRKEKIELDKGAAPEWLFENPVAERFPPRPLQPSKPLSKETRVFSPLETNGTSHNVFKRGNLIHHLLQVLPDLPGDTWQSIAMRYLSQEAHGLSDDEKNTLWQEIESILHHPAFAPIFASGSRAEVPITGNLNDRYIVSGQVDRLVVTDKDVLIVDYKTNRPPPESVDGVPEIYRQQLAGYRAVLQNIYPDKNIRCALLWTHTARLMELPEAMLDEGLKLLLG